MKLTSLLPLLLPALLAACTGTTEPQSQVRLALINSGGGQLQTLTPGGSPEAPLPVSGAPAVDTEVLPGGSQLLIAFRDRIELRDASLKFLSTLPLPAGFQPCFVRLRASPARDRIAALSDCGSGAPQQLVVYRSDASLAFNATLPPPTPSTSDQSRFAVSTAQTVWLTRPATGGGSELLRADETGITVVTVPPLPVNVYDLAMLGDTLYAATDAGVRQVTQGTGALASSPVPALTGQVNRLYGGDRLLGAWLSGAGSQPLTIWNGTTAGVALYTSDLRDLTFAPDGNAFALSSSALTQLDTVLGLRQGIWTPSDLVTTLNDARATTWLTAP